MSSPATVFVVDDHLGMRRSLRALLESAGLAVETYGSGEEFLQAYAPERSGCLLLDIRLQRSNGLDLQDELVRRKATLPIIVLTGHGTVPASVRALKAGAMDFLQKPVPPKLLLERVTTALERDREMRATSAERSAVERRLERLTRREREVMEHLLSGRTSKEIAATLSASPRTVEGHRRMIFSKMGVSSAAQLVRVVLDARGTGARG
ncbi:MAG TPA: response regulator [Candidatus Binatia bacterium]|nr:response regulator [Candidatus Binatia bacterium]